MERVTYVGHATVVIETGGARLLTDPLLRPRAAMLTRRVAPAEPPGRCDAVLISHAHRDHLDVPSLRLLGPDLQVIAPRGSGQPLSNAGVADLTEVQVGDEIDVGGVKVAVVPATHGVRRNPLGTRTPAVGFVVGGRNRVYFAGDTDLFEGMAALGPLDVALLPVWGWGPSLGHGHMDPARAARALTMLSPRLAIPIHWGTLYPAGLGWFRPRLLTEPPRRFARHAAELAPDVDVQVLEPGESLALSGRSA